MNEDRFRFENDDLDFPIYDKNPYVPKWGWAVLFLTIPIGLLLALSPKIPIAILSCLVVLIPLLYFLKWDIKAIYQKPRLKDVGIAVLLFAGYMIYSLALLAVLEQFGIVGGNLVGESTVTVMTMLPMVFTLMTEELIKFIPFMFFLRVGYKYSHNRKRSVVVASIW
ncbi:MAG: hypothetical protein Q4Q37_07240 [Methanobrevibacter sp.]|nr:hypothetical protein [Methanobrevibacter sp.]